MRKLLLVLLLAALPLAAQREVRGTVPDDSGIPGTCPPEKLLRAGVDGLISIECLPTASVELGWFIANPAIAASSTVKHFLPNKQAGRVTEVACETDTGTVNLNFDSRNKTDLETPGTDLHTSEIVADDDSVTVTTFAGDAENAANQAWVLSISGVSGSPTLLSCWMTVERL